MKKLFLMLALMLTMCTFAQVQERHQYSTVSLTENGKTQTNAGDCTIYVNYENKPVIKLLFANGGYMYYDCVSQVSEGATANGTQYWYGQYKERGKDNMVIIQLFKDESYGIRFIDAQGNMVQIY